MNHRLLIVGAGTYAAVAAEIAASMGCFERIAFIDDGRKTTANGKPVIGTTEDICRLSDEYDSIVVAIGDPEIRLALLERLKTQSSFRIATLISPRAYVSPSAQIAEGCVIEPMAVVHTGCRIARGCIISAGAVINHETTCHEGVHVDCNATVAGYACVPAKKKVFCGEIFQQKA